MTDSLMRQGRMIFAWALATVRATLPDAVRKFGRSPDAALYRLDTEMGPVVTGLRLRSILGEASRVATTDGPIPATAEIELAEADQYRRILDISEGAARRGRPALELRLHEFSPIPVEQAEFDYRLLPPNGGAGYQAEVSVVRRALLQQVAETLPGERAGWSFVGAVDANGEPGFRYGAGAPVHAPRLIGAGFGLLMVIAASVLVCLAWADRFSRQAETLELRRVELIGFARDLRDADLDIERAERVREAGAATVPLDRIVAALRALGLSEPEELTIQSITLEAPAVLAIDGSGFDAAGAPITTHLQLPLGETP